MSSQATKASPSKRRHFLPETTPEREAKRQHLQNYGTALEQTTVKRESDDKEVHASSGTLRNGDIGGDLGVEAVNSSTDHDHLIQSVQNLASYYGDYRNGNSFIRGAFEFVFEQRLELANDHSLSGKPQIDLIQWLTDLPYKQHVPLESLTRIAEALRKEMSNHVIKSWASKRDTSMISPTLDLLQEVRNHDIQDVSEIILLLQRVIENAAKAQSHPPAKAAPAKKTRSAKKAKSEPATTVMNPETGSVSAQNLKSGEPGPTTTAVNTSNSKLKRDSNQPKDAISTSRAKSEAQTMGDKSLRERSEVPPISSSSSPALAKFKEGFDPKKTRASGTVRRTALDTRAKKDISPVHQPPPSRNPRSSTLVRYLKPGDSSLLVFFIGPSMNTILEEEIDAACKEAFGNPFCYSHRWSGSVWVAHMYSMPDVHANVINVQGIQLIAQETHSAQKVLFVACCAGFDVDDDDLKEAIEDRTERALGPSTIYRAPPAHRLRRYVFLQISKPPPKLFINVGLADDLGQDQVLTFVPAIMDLHEPCFYCDLVHDGYLCSAAVQLSKFSSKKT